ncbi:MAG TPA: DMT family transporter [Accumulibacter sp.]|uniref:Carboxylate/amino acid/amine transporter n=2 Tax=Candidatus Accumulibacter TaxID=327159 RepID=A0A080MF49_9PROT|nr:MULTISPECIES: DMT family transporter [Candidatus Accumulibacter]KFB75839.1 MAG: carboxylate/amino acid/amine transporter [Candidatus Accumulibacter cognatus]MBL8400589.1 DMT family transporter [Accumulibacter sp.]MCM8579245.1 DMT family transporter [Accumulibacter sp.]MCM8622844.1 DMT family transporter [Accumulibacter sp.]MCQ1549821.1 DMT family transporter [Candidatus Accumulibacter phosphatis]
MQSLWMLLASLFFACMGVCAKLVAATHSVVEIVFYRSILSLVLVYALVRLRGVPLATPHWHWQISRGLVGFAALVAYFWAITRLPLATAVTLNYTSAIFLAIYLVFTGHRLNAGIIGALALGLTGIGLLLKPSLHADQLLSGLIGLGSGMLAGMAYFSVRELGARGEPESRTVFYFALVSSACGSLWLPFSPLHPVDLRSGVLLFGVAAFATAAQLAMTRAYTRAKPLLAAALAYSTVVFSSLFGILLWNEAHDAWSWLAIGLIVLSGLAATHFSPARSARRPAP